MHRQIVVPQGVYPPTADFSQAIRVSGGDLIFVSGIIGMRPDGTMPAGARDQVEFALQFDRVEDRVRGQRLERAGGQEALQFFVVRDHELEQAIELAGEMVALEHFGHGRDASAKALHRVGAVVRQHDEHKTEQVEADGLAID